MDTELVIYGTRAIMEAVNAGKEFERLFIQKNINNELLAELITLLRTTGIHYQRVPVEKLNSITRKNHQGVVGFISPISYSSLDHIVSSAYEAGKAPLLLILDRITDVRNFGAISRTAECTGVHGIVIPVKGGAQINSDAIKTSAGALSYLPVCREWDLGETLKNLQNSGLRVIALSEHSENSIFDLDLKGPLAIILGSEKDGIQKEYLRSADDIAGLPILGNISSLNVSVATGAILYEVIRQRSL